MKSPRKIIWISIIVVILMFAFGFAMVPLYNAICQITGIGGKTSGEAAPTTTNAVDQSRSVTVQFVTQTNAHLPWKFYAGTPQIALHPGEAKQIFFYAKNMSDHTITAQAIPSVSPGLAAKYLKKTECFCFNSQTLKAGESIEMPVIFYIDPALPKNISTFTLAYTMFDTSAIPDEPNEVKGRIS
jgi:cytochrome c oxidase assembly protein subunit 11